MTPELTAAIARLDNYRVEYDDKVNCATEPSKYERANAERDVGLVLDELRRLQEAETAVLAAQEDARGEATFNDRT